LHVYPTPMRVLLKIKLPQSIHCGKFLGVDITFLLVNYIGKKGDCQFEISKRLFSIILKYFKP